VIRLFRGALGLIVIYTFALGLVIFLTQPQPNPMLDSPAAFGIDLSTTHFETLLSTLQRVFPEAAARPDGGIDLGDREIYALNYLGQADTTGPIARLCIRGTGRLGDVLSEYGIPEGVRFSRVLPTQIEAVLSYDRRAAQVILSFPSDTWMQVQTPILSVCYYDQFPVRTPLEFDWQGLGVQNRYFPPAPDQPTF
jgi:hypothetical protein